MMPNLAGAVGGASNYLNAVYNPATSTGMTSSPMMANYRNMNASPNNTDSLADEYKLTAHSPGTDNLEVGDNGRTVSSSPNEAKPQIGQFSGSTYSDAIAGQQFQQQHSAANSISGKHCLAKTFI